MRFSASQCQADKVRPWKGMPYATEFEIIVGSICYQKELQISDIFQVEKVLPWW